MVHLSLLDQRRDRTEGLADNHIYQTGALRVIADAFAVLDIYRSQGLAGFDFDEFDSAGEDSTAGGHTHAKRSSRSAAHVYLADGEHKLILRLGRVLPNAMVFEVIVFAALIGLPNLRIDRYLYAFLVLFVETLASRVLLPRRRIDHSTLHFRPVFDPVRALFLVVRINGT